MVRLLSRRPRPPAQLRALLARDERVLAWAPVGESAAVVATPPGLWWPFEDGPRRIGWCFVDKLTWRDGVLSVIEADLVDDLLLVDRPAVSVSLDEPRDLPPTARRRVEGTVSGSELYPVYGGVARIVARRVPGRDGLVWWARLEDGTRDTPRARTEIRDRIEVLAELAAQTTR